jgi:uncharacterized protein (DUF3084 family)
MQNQGRIEELLAEALKKYDRMLEKHDVMIDRQDQMVAKQDEMVAKQDETNRRLENVEKRLGGVEDEIQKLTLQTSSNTRAVMQLASDLVVVFDHEKRIDKLEGTVYK